MEDAHINLPSIRPCCLLIGRLRKLEGIGVDSTRTELFQLIHQSLKDTEQDLEVYLVFRL